jgi:hypothetical protein
MAARLDPSSLAAALAIEETLSARDLTPAFRKRLDEFRQVVHLRHRIHEEIRP